MSFGILIYGNSGGLVIDDNYPGYALTQTGAISVSVNTSFRHSDVIQLSRPSILPPIVVAKWPDNDNVFCFGADPVGSPGNWTGVKLLMRASSGTHTVPVSYRLFTETPRSSGFALEVFAPDGKVAFSSDYRPLDLSVRAAGAFGLGDTWTGGGPLFNYAYSARPHPSAELILSFSEYFELVRLTRLIDYQGQTAVCNKGYGYATQGRFRTMAIANASHNQFWFSNSDGFIGIPGPVFIP